MSTNLTVALLAATASLVLTGHVLAKDNDNDNHGKAPGFIVGDILHQSYNGDSDDLLTAGLGHAGIGNAAVPSVSNPASAAQLRRLVIYNNYRALIDPTTGGGYGTFYGPKVPLTGSVALPNDGKIAGDEFLALARSGRGGDDGDDDDDRDGGNGVNNVTMMVQVPAHFDPAKPCIVTGPSSGSRGVYGAIGTSGDWGLKRGCAVAYTDKGSGTGAHDLQNDKVHLITGVREFADVAGDASTFTANLSDVERAAFNAATPNRFAFEHAHSRVNPEKDWGRNVLQSVKFAFYVLNERMDFPGAKRFTPKNTIVIASSVSNGGGASVRAAEQDKDRLIDAVVVSEPNVNPEFDKRFAIKQGTGAPLLAHSRSLHDYTTLVNVFQGCASAALDLAAAPFNFAPSAGRCAALAAAGLVSGTGVPAQAASAQAAINAYGILVEQNIVQPSHWFAYVPQSIAMLYSNAYGQFGVEDNLCGYSYGATNAGGTPDVLVDDIGNSLFGTSNGIPPTPNLPPAAFGAPNAGVHLINNLADGGAKEDRVSKTNQNSEQNLAGALCLRRLATGLGDDGSRLDRAERRNHKRVQDGVEDIRANGDLNGRPAIFVTGRADAILPPNHASRAYVGRNRLVEGNNSRLSYYEITNAQHLDNFNRFGGFDSRFIPLHYYFIQALNMMYQHLTEGTPLPKSQVVHTIPRGTGAPALTAANVPAIAATPLADDRILFNFDAALKKHVVLIPE